MPPKSRIRRKDLRRPDEFVTKTSQAIRFAREHAQPVMWGAGVVVLLVGASLAVVSFRQLQRQQASAEMGNAMAAFNGQRYADALTMFDDFSHRWASSDTAPIAKLYAGKASLALRKYDDAVAAVEAVLPELREEYLRQQALVTLGYALEGKQDYPGAARRFAEAAALHGPYLEQAVLGEARARDLAGDTVAAKEAYTRFLNDFSTSPEADRVRELLAQKP